LPPPWRVSACLSRIENTTEQTYLGQDVLTWHSVAEEQDLGVSGGTGPTGAFAWVITVEVQVSGQTAADFATARAGGSGGRSDPDTIGGRPAARVADGSGNTIAYYVANGGRMYSIQIVSTGDPRPAQLSPATFDAIAHSVSFTTPTARPTPTTEPVPTAAVEAVADAVAAAFAASDADRLHDLMTPVCWFNSGVNQSEGSAASRDKLAARLRTSFSQGLKVTVEPRPIMTKPPMPGSFWVWSTWSAYGTTPKSNVQLVFDQIDGRWYWIGALFNATR
jgi:ketosteroid isomerase-like protein